MTKILQDYENAIAVTREIHWVGYYDTAASLHCNPFILIDEEDVVLFDPGSIPHFPIIMRKVIDLVNPKEISVIVTSHEDPDVCGNLAVVEDIVGRKDLKIALHGHAVRFVRHYGVQAQFYEVEKQNFTLTLKSGRQLEFLFVPYLHSPGAIMTYDPKTRSLFTGDVFGAISTDWSLFADKNFLEPMKAFHQIYMPSHRVLTQCMERLETMEIDRILPQHGSVLEGEKVKIAIQFLKGLPCGVDCLEEKEAADE